MASEAAGEVLPNRTLVRSPKVYTLSHQMASGAAGEILPNRTLVPSPKVYTLSHPSNV